MANREEYADVPSFLGDAILSALEQADRSLRAVAIAEASRTVDPEDLIKAMGEQENHVRRNAAIGALTQGGARTIPSLIRALHDKDPEVVLFAVGVLGKTRDPAAIPHLVSMIDHEDINVAQAAIDSLSQLRPMLAVDALVGVLDRDPWLRFAAVHALGEIGDPRAIRSLVPLLEDETVRDAVIEALGKIGSVDSLATLSTLLRESQDSVSFAVCLRAIGEVLANYPNEHALRNVTEWVKLQSDASSSSELQSRLLEVLAPEDNDGTNDEPDAMAAKGAAASVVRALRLRPLYTSLVLAGRHPMLREMLQFCVVSIGPDTAPSLRLGLEHPNHHVALVACRCVGTMGLTEFAPKLEALVTHPSEELRIAAIDSLSRLHAVKAIKTIVQQLTDPSVTVQKAARAALSSMESEEVTSQLLFVKVDPVARRGALEVMQTNPNPRQLAFIRAALTDPQPDVRCAAILALAAQPRHEMLKPLEPLLNDPVLAVRRVAVNVLGKTRDARVRELLLAQIERDPGTRAEAILAVSKVGDASVAPHLIEIFDRESEPVRLAIIEALAELKQPLAEPMLVRLLADGSPNIRRAVVKALLAFASPAAMRHVVTAARDTDWQVRFTIAEQLPLAHESARAAIERLCMDANRRVADTARQRLEAEAAPLH
jgi:HEAT repeat protein